VKGDPFRDFAGFATRVLDADTPLAAAPGATAEQVRAAGRVQLDVAFPNWRANLAECAQAFERVAGGQARNLREVLEAFPPGRRRSVELGVLWLAKHGFLDWPS